MLLADYDGANIIQNNICSVALPAVI